MVKVSYFPQLNIHGKSGFISSIWNAGSHGPKLLVSDNAARSVIRTLPKILDGVFLRKWLTAKRRWLFSQKAPSLMFDSVLNTPRITYNITCLCLSCNMKFISVHHFISKYLKVLVKLTKHYFGSFKPSPYLLLFTFKFFFLGSFLYLSN